MLRFNYLFIFSSGRIAFAIRFLMHLAELPTQSWLNAVILRNSVRLTIEPTPKRHFPRKQDIERSRTLSGLNIQTHITKV